MKISVKVKTKSKLEGVEKSDDIYIVRVNVPPVEGRANIRVIELLSKFFNTPKSKVVLVHGAKSKLKVFEVMEK